MSWNIANNGIITLHAGDYFEAPLFLNIGDFRKYELQDGDKVYFGIMEPNQPFEWAIVRKVLTKDDVDESGNPVIKLKTKDTIRLMPGLYYYEVKLAMASEDSDSDDFDEPILYTVVPKTKLFLLE